MFTKTIITSKKIKLLMLGRCYKFRPKEWDQKLSWKGKYLMEKIITWLQQIPICIFYLSDLYHYISIIQLGSNAQKLDVYFRCPSWSSCGADHNPSYGVKIMAIRWAWSIMWRIFFSCRIWKCKEIWYYTYLF